VVKFKRRFLKSCGNLVKICGYRGYLEMNKRRHPDWLKVKIPSGKKYHRIKSLLASSRLHTICEEAKCPNIAECFSKGTATFLILGDNCKRYCTY